MKFIAIGGIYINMERVNRVYTEDVKGSAQPFHVIVRCAENDYFRMQYESMESRDQAFSKMRDVFQVLD